MESISNKGSVEDIRCSLSHMNPQTKSEIQKDLKYLNFSLGYEIIHKNRSTVIRMIQSRLKQLKKQVQ